MLESLFTLFLIKFQAFQALLVLAAVIPFSEKHSFHWKSFFSVEVFSFIKSCSFYPLQTQVYTTQTFIYQKGVEKLVKDEYK